MSPYVQGLLSAEKIEEEVAEHKPDDHGQQPDGDDQRNGVLVDFLGGYPVGHTVHNAGDGVRGGQDDGAVGTEGDHAGQHTGVDIELGAVGACDGEDDHAGDLVEQELGGECGKEGNEDNEDKETGNAVADNGVEHAAEHGLDTERLVGHGEGKRHTDGQDVEHGPGNAVLGSVDHVGKDAAVLAADKAHDDKEHDDDAGGAELGEELADSAGGEHTLDDEHNDERDREEHELLLVRGHLLAAFKIVSGLYTLKVGADNKLADQGIENERTEADDECGDGVADKADVAAGGLDVADKNAAGNAEIKEGKAHETGKRNADDHEGDVLVALLEAQVLGKLLEEGPDDKAGGGHAYQCADGVGGNEEQEGDDPGAALCDLQAHNAAHDVVGNTGLIDEIREHTDKPDVNDGAVAPAGGEETAHRLVAAEAGNNDTEQAGPHHVNRGPEVQQSDIDAENLHAHGGNGGESGKITKKQHDSYTDRGIDVISGVLVFGLCG